jgi:hypothetical protein
VFRDNCFPKGKTDVQVYIGMCRSLRNKPVAEPLTTTESLHSPLLNFQVFLFPRIIQLGKPRRRDGHLRIPEIKCEILYAVLWI